MLRWILLVVLCVCAVPVGAQTLQKCVGKGGAVAFRSGACEAGEKLVELRDGRSDIRSSEDWERLRDRQERDERGARYLSRIAGTDGMMQAAPPRRSRRNPKVVQCEGAKAARDSAIKQLQGHASGATHSYWNNRVYEACKP